MRRSHQVHSAVAVLLALAVAPTVAAQAEPPPLSAEDEQAFTQYKETKKGASFRREFGSGSARGAVRLYAGLNAHADRQAREKSLVYSREGAQLPETKPKPVLGLKAGAAGDIYLFNGWREALALEMTLTKRKAKKDEKDKSASDEKGSPFQVVTRIAGFTVALDKKDTTSGRSRSNAVASREEAQAPRSLIPQDINLRYVLGLVPVVVRANAGVGLDFAAMPRWGEDGIGLEVEVNPYVEGWASGGIGGGVGPIRAEAGIRATLRLLDLRGGVRLNAASPLQSLVSDLSERHDPAVVAALLNEKNIDLTATLVNDYQQISEWDGRHYIRNGRGEWVPLLWTPQRVERVADSGGSNGAVYGSLEAVSARLDLYALAQIKFKVWRLTFTKGYSWSKRLASWSCGRVAFETPLSVPVE